MSRRVTGKQLILYQLTGRVPRRSLWRRKGARILLVTALCVCFASLANQRRAERRGPGTRPCGRGFGWLVQPGRDDAAAVSDPIFAPLPARR